MLQRCWHLNKNLKSIETFVLLCTLLFASKFTLLYMHLVDDIFKCFDTVR